MISRGRAAYNIALPKLGQDFGTSTVATWELQFWAGLVLISFTFYLNFKYSMYHYSRAGQSLNIPTSAMQTVVRQVRQKYPEHANLFVSDNQRPTIKQIT